VQKKKTKKKYIDRFIELFESC